MTVTFTYLPGDGIGPEIGEAALQILAAAAEQFGFALSADTQVIGGAAIDAQGTPLPQATIDSVLQTKTVLLGAVGGPKWDHLQGAARTELGGLLPLRKLLGVYANLRPAKYHAALAAASPLKHEVIRDVDFVVVRELTGGIYFGNKGVDDQGAFDECRYTDAEVARIAGRAFELARSRRRKVTSVDKSNVLETSRLWRRVVTEVHARYPDVALEHILVDACAMHLLSRPASFDVIVAENMFGDILTDEASMLCGSLGVIPSASLGDGNKGLYEPIHGSAPDIAGQNRANPIAMVLSTEWMLRESFAQVDAADAIEAAVSRALDAGNVTADLGGTLTTAQVAAAIASDIRA